MHQNAESSAADIERLVRAELSDLSNLNNWHGITASNIEACLRPPEKATVFADTLGSDPAVMWIIMAEPVAAGYLVAYAPFSPEDERWCLVEQAPDGRLVCDTVGEGTLIDALNAM